MIDSVNISEIKANPNNPRLIKDEKYKQLVKSIQDFPQMLEIRPIVVNDDMVVLGGNMRLKACKEAGMKQVPVIKASQLTEDQQKEFIIKDNVGFGEWDWSMIANEWDTEQVTDWGLDIPDFPTGEAQEDDYEIPDEIQTDIVAGDLFEIGPHRLLCGDSTKGEDVAKLMNGQKADMVFTDPPYGVNYEKKTREIANQRKNPSVIKDDNTSVSELFSKLTTAFQNLKEVSNNCCTYFVTAPQGGDLGMMMMMMKAAGLPVRHVLIWKKNHAVFSMGRLDYDYQHEPILLTWNKTHKFYGMGKHKTSIWEIDRPSASKEHPTMKPVELVANSLLNNSKEGDIVCDFFSGSGTTMVAGHQLNRKVYMIDIDPKYCQVTVDRMAKLDPAIEIKINGKAYKHLETTVIQQ